MSDLPQIPPDKLARMIDHTLLKPDATRMQIKQLCEEAQEYHFATVCVNPAYVADCKMFLGESDVGICSVVAFPLGATVPPVKAHETQYAATLGATEVDVVVNIGAVKSHDYYLVQHDISTVVGMAHYKKAIVKIIIEAALLTDEEKETVCRIAAEAGADFVKTSTGFGPGGATVEDVALMRRVVGHRVGVKAAGGIRSYEDALRMIAAGANRIGASAGVKIIQEARDAYSRL